MTPTVEDMEFARYGVALSSVGEDGDHYVALGHPPLRRFVAALNAYEREVCGMLGLNEVTATGLGLKEFGAEVTQRWAQFEAGTDRTDYSWRLEWCDESAPGAVAVTRWWV
ncbi:hypothetical protein A6I87_02590 [Prescottella equi]|nr:hypothetical protein A6I87_02590 [Prescottella equi]